MDTQEIIDWLASDEGMQWAFENFDDATECHAIIEVTYDYHPDEQWWGDSLTESNRAHFLHLRWRVPAWRDLKWTPDQPPEGGNQWKKTKKKKQRTPSSSTRSPSK